MRRTPELFEEAAALRLELPSRSAAGIADILWHRHGVRVSERTLRMPKLAASPVAWTPLFPAIVEAVCVPCPPKSRGERNSSSGMIGDADAVCEVAGG